MLNARIPQQHPYAHFSTNGQVFTPEETYLALSRRPGSIVALKAAARGTIINSEPLKGWYSADTRLLRIHGCLRKVSRRLDLSVCLEITDKGRDVLFLFGEVA